MLARKRRPQTFESLIGQQHIARTLRNAIEADRLAHAYIFSGLRGTGKTSVARILAKCLNCEKGPTPDPCNECTPCTEITQGRSIDVLEMDAASRTGVGDIRELQEVVSYAPARDRFKVLIIDEVHMLSKSAFNALLKTLEEPPPRVVFILATTEIQKVLPTILSRCQVFEFRRVTPRELTLHLRTICDSEGITITDEALDRISRAGEGSVRDSLSVLERILAFCGTEVEDQDVLQVLGAVRAEILVRMVHAIAERNAGEMLATLDAVMDEGRDLLHFWSELLAIFRDLLIARVAGADTELLSRSPDEIRTLDKNTATLSREDLNRVLGLLVELEPGLKSSSQPRFLFESALIRIASLGAVVPIEKFLESLTGGGGELSSPPGEQKKKILTPDEPAPADFRSGLLASIKKRSRPMITALIGHASAVELQDDQAIIRFPAGAESFKSQAERDETMSLLQSCAGEAAGRHLVLRVEMDTATEVRAGSGRSAATGPGNQGPRRPAGDRRQLMEMAGSDPAVKHLLREFGAQIVDIRPLDPETGTEETS
ncbi:MAG: DNA polymerase III subunit gamma/tau [Acidobacteria bacterium]|uniref:DNA polymerase III subunit gamma/tau n=1 Tax=Candidatus Polarisedimenticola svalbardensis TaxID=2886004 RepID=A0A8J6XW96_9BACT|nr:DNA polymerase III subunit gamma/tau [Candidatus Polarisedimenticola svalbardensis]